MEKALKKKTLKKHWKALKSIEKALNNYRKAMKSIAKH